MDCWQAKVDCRMTSNGNGVVQFKLAAWRGCRCVTSQAPANSLNDDIVAVQCCRSISLASRRRAM